MRIYADDITVWTAHTDPYRANTNLQEAINEIATWTNKWGLKISIEKPECCSFYYQTLLKNIQTEAHPL